MPRRKFPYWQFGEAMADADKPSSPCCPRITTTLDSQNPSLLIMQYLARTFAQSNIANLSQQCSSLGNGRLHTHPNRRRSFLITLDGCMEPALILLVEHHNDVLQHRPSLIQTWPTLTHRIQVCQVINMLLFNHLASPRYHPRLVTVKSSEPSGLAAMTYLARCLDIDTRFECLSRLVGRVHLPS